MTFHLRSYRLLYPKVCIIEKVSLVVKIFKYYLTDNKNQTLEMSQKPKSKMSDSERTALMKQMDEELEEHFRKIPLMCYRKRCPY